MPGSSGPFHFASQAASDAHCIAVRAVELGSLAAVESSFVAVIVVVEAGGCSQRLQ